MSDGHGGGREGSDPDHLGEVLTLGGSAAPWSAEFWGEQGDVGGDVIENIVNISTPQEDGSGGDEQGGVAACMGVAAEECRGVTGDVCSSLVAGGDGRVGVAPGDTADVSGGVRGGVDTAVAVAGGLAEDFARDVAPVVAAGAAAGSAAGNTGEDLVPMDMQPFGSIENVSCGDTPLDFTI